MTHPEIAKAMGCSKSMVGLYLDPGRMAKHRERAKMGQRKRYAADPDKVKASSAAWAARNRDKVNATARDYWKNNLERKRKYVREYYREQRAKSPKHTMIHRMRCALSGWMWGRSKVRRDGLDVSTLVGCSPEQFRAHLASLFTGKMSWETYGTEWEVDHIQPFISFDMLNPKELAKAMHYTNTRPLNPSINRGRERREKALDSYPTN